jgi:hypothetical protein
MNRITLGIVSLLWVAAPFGCSDEDEVPGPQRLGIARVRDNAACPSRADCSPNPPPSPHLNYYGGPIIANAKVTQVLYGSGSYIPGVATTGVPSIASFFQQVLNSPYIDWLIEYNTPTQSIGRGQFVGQRSITPDPTRNGTVITDLQIQAELDAQISANHLPAPDANTIYMINFPSGKTTTFDEGKSTFTSCVDFCAYHSTFQRNGQNVYYGVLPNLTDGLCSSGCGRSTVFNNTTMVASHELVEAITDPAVGLTSTLGAPLAWVAPGPSTYSEIGDICNGEPGLLYGSDGHTYTVQKEWSNSESSCVPGAVQPARGSWYPPSRSGNGLFVGTIPSGGLYVIWFTYTTAGTPTWYASNLSPRGDFFGGTLYSYTWVNNHAVAQSRGSVSFVTTTPTTGRFVWNLEGAIGSYNVQYLAFGSGGSTGATGSWYAPTQSGWGEFFDQQGTSIVSYLSLYTASGQPTWVYGSGSVSGNTAATSLLYVTSTGLCPSCTGPASTSTVATGSLSLSGITANNASLSLGFTDTPPAPTLSQWNRSALPIGRLTN